MEIYYYFIDKIYRNSRDEIYLNYLCETIAKINAIEYADLYKDILLSPMTQSAESIIKMMSANNAVEFDEIIFTLIKKENLIPKA